MRALFRLFFRVRVVGLENVPPTQAIVCANHLGWADPFLILLFLPVEPRIYALGLHPARASALRSWIVDALQVMIALDPARSREALVMSADLLRRGGSLLVFPEGGTQGGEEGKLRPLQHGASRLSVDNGAPILPVSITGTRELWLCKTLTLRVGLPLDPAAYGGDTRQRSHLLTGALESSLSGLLRGEKAHPRVKLLKAWLTGLFV